MSALDRVVTAAHKRPGDGLSKVLRLYNAEGNPFHGEHGWFSGPEGGGAQTGTGHTGEHPNTATGGTGHHPGTTSTKAQAPSPEALNAAGNVLAKAQQNEPAITNTLDRMEETLPGDVTLQGLKFRVKGQGSMARKIDQQMAEKNLSADAAAAQIKDAVRYTFQVRRASEYMAAHDKASHDLQARGYTLLKDKNTWPFERSYRGINMNFRAPNGQTFELQFHTPRSLAVKEQAHVIYERTRTMPWGPERQGLEKRMGDMFASLDAPPGSTHRR